MCSNKMSSVLETGTKVLLCHNKSQSRRLMSLNINKNLENDKKRFQYDKTLDNFICCFEIQ